VLHAISENRQKTPFNSLVKLVVFSDWRAILYARNFENMSILNTIEPKVAERWIGEYERKRADNKSSAARARQELGKIIDLAEGAGLNRKAFTDELKSREWQRKMESLAAGDNGDVAEAKEQLKKALGGLPLGDWGVEAISDRKKNAAAPGTEPATLTLAEAKAILEKPKGRGRPSAQRVEAERVVAEHAKDPTPLETAIDGASGDKAAAMADAMGDDDPADALSSLTDDDRGENVEDIRPRWAKSDSAA
jgi:hypothetical protein